MLNILPDSLKNIAKKIISRLEFRKNPDDCVILENPDLNELKKKYNNAWKNDAIPYEQMAKIEARKDLENYENNPALKAAVDLLKKINTGNKTLLEIGCSSGYYSEVFKKTGFNFTYEGCDYSEEFIQMAKTRYPDIKFKVSDATDLDYKNDEFDIVISGCCILHIVDYQKAISEASRTAKDYVIFHRTPVIHRRPTTFAAKTAYKTKMLEIFFNEEELADLFFKNNLSIASINTHSVSAVEGLKEPVFTKSYLCKKITG